LVAFVISSYGLVIGPAVRDISHVRIENENTRLQYRVQFLLGKVKTVLETGARYVEDDALTHNDLVRLNQVFRPLLENTPEIGAILFVHESGREFLLGRDVNGGWVNRVSDPAAWGRMAYWLQWGKGNVPEKVEAREQDFDARTRPWFKGAIAQTQAMPTYWTDPYMFYMDRVIYTKNEPGITVAKHLRMASGNYVMALDVRLRDLLLAVSRVTVGKNGKAALLFRPGQQVADQANLPDGTPIWSMKQIEALSDPAVMQGFQQWQRQGALRPGVVNYQVDGARWLGYFNPISIGTAQPQWLGIFVPWRDFMPETTRSYLFLVAALIVVALLLALALAAWLGKKHFAAPLRQLIRESERLARLELQEPIEIPPSWEEVNKVAAAQEAMRRELLSAYQNLRGINALLEQKIHERTTTLEQISNEAQRSSRALAEIAASLPCAIFRFERPAGGGEGKFTFISDNVRDVLGFSRQDIQANPELRWTHILPEDEGKARQLLQEPEDGEENENAIIERIDLPEKGTRWVEARARRSPMENGGHCWHGYWLDVTEEQRVRQQLANQLLFQEALFDALANPIFVKGTDNRYISCNRAYEQAFGVRRTELAGKTVLEIQHLPAREREMRHEEDRRILSGLETTVRRETDVRYADGSVRRLLCLITSFKLSDGNPGGVIGITVDVTSMKEMRENLENARDTAERATRVKEDFIANMSHEIRTPMNTILGMTRLALQTRPNARQRDYLVKILLSGQHLLDIINDILDFSKIEAGKLGVEHVKFDLESVLETIKGLIAAKAAAKGLELVFETAPDVPFDLVGDPLRLGQVLVNYANNAVKFTRQGEIGIRIAVRADDSDGVLLHFAVRDTGIGLDDAAKNRLFQSFSQADMSTTRQYGGTGLGLVISKQLAKLMGGEVGVESELGQGSTFWFTARLTRGAQTPRATCPHPELAGSRILVADDNASARRAASGILRGMALEVREASSGLAALEACRQSAAEGSPFHLVILDRQMPDMDGIEAARRLREEFREHCPGLVLLTFYGQDEVSDVSGIGAGHILVKPVMPSSLANTVMRLLGGSEPAAPIMDAGLAIDMAGLKAIAGARILLVEDNELNQQVAREILDLAGFETDIADNGATALEKVRNIAGRPYDIILMDERMPVMDGLEATRRLRAEGCAIPIVALTASIMSGERERCLNAGMNGYVTKPIEPAHLWNALCKWIPPRRAPAERGDAAAAVSVAAVSAPAAADPVELPRDIPGLDINAGLRSTFGRMPLYLGLLEKFLKSHARDPEHIHNAIGGADWPLAARLAHTLKSVAGSIGASAIQTTVSRLESACGQENRDEARRLTDEMAGQLAPLLERLSALFERVPKEASTPGGDPYRMSSVAERLACLLAENDAAALDCLQNEGGLLHQCLQTHFADLETAIGAFEFDTALSILCEACAEQHIGLDRTALTH
jgi:PAS domain S-box-containing protein